MRLTAEQYDALPARLKPLPPLDTAAARIGSPMLPQPTHGKAASRHSEPQEAKSTAPATKTPGKGKRKAGVPRQPSHLEAKFARLWAEVGGPELTMEHRFHPKRRWRSDFAHLQSRTLIEVEGGAWAGRHTRGGGFLADAEKYLAAYLLGWHVVRLTAPQLTHDNVLAVALRVGLTTP